MIVSSETEIGDDEYEEVITVLNLSKEQTTSISADNIRLVTLGSADQNSSRGLLDNLFQEKASIFIAVVNVFG